VWGIRGVVGRWGWDVESPHVLADSFRANKNGCRVSRRKDGECGGGEEAGARGLEKGGDGEERVREGSIGGRPERNREREAREVKVSAGSSGEDRSIGKGKGHWWKLGGTHEVCKRGEDRLSEKDMGSAGVGKDGRRDDRAQQGSMVRVVVVGIVRFQRGEGVRVRETRVRWGRDCSRDKREGGVREGGGCVEGGKGVYKNSGG
jgi:hypothetical protein